MKLWVWDNVLCDYNCGAVLVYAETEERAWELLKEREHIAYSVLRGYPSGDEVWGDATHYRPRLVESEEAFAIWGGG